MRKCLNVKHISDKGGSLVETQIRVSHKGSSKHTEQLKYCVNMYHTKSKLMVNGNGVKEYVKDHKEIVKALLSCDNLNDLDRALYTKIHDELLKIGHTEHSKRQRTNAPAGAGQALGSTPSKYPRLPAPGSNQIDPQEDTLVSNDGADRDSSALLCLHCNELMEEDLIECGTCSSWYHYGCENLSRVEFTYHIDNPDVTFECTVCTSLRRDDLVEGLVPPGGCSGSLRDILLDAGECSLSDGGASPADMGRQGTGGPSVDRDDSSSLSLSHTLGLHDVTSNARGINVTDRRLVLGAPTSTGRDTMGANVPFYPTSGLINRVPVSSDYVPCHTGVLGPAMVSGGVSCSGLWSGSLPTMSTMSSTSVITSTAGAKRKMSTTRSRSAVTPSASEGGLSGSDTTMAIRSPVLAVGLVSGTSAQGSKGGHAGGLGIGPEDGGSLQEQVLKSKEKMLVSKEKRLKELEKKISNREISLGDKLDQNEFSKAYITSMENKLKELEASNRLLRLKLLAVPDVHDSNSNHDSGSGGTTFCEQNAPLHRKSGDNCHSLDRAAFQELQQRVLSLELKMMEQRLSTLENQRSVYCHTGYDGTNQTHHADPKPHGMNISSNSVNFDLSSNSNIPGYYTNRDIMDYNVLYEPQGLADAHYQWASSNAHSHSQWAWSNVHNYGPHDRHPSNQPGMDGLQPRTTTIQDTMQTGAVTQSCESQSIPVHFSRRGRRPRVRQKNRHAQSNQDTGREKEETQLKERSSISASPTNVKAGEDEACPQ